MVSSRDCAPLVARLADLLRPRKEILEAYLSTATGSAQRQWPQ